MLLLAVFAAADCVLAFVGVYGLMAFGVAERSREIGVRVALGARPSDIARSILAQAATLTGVGTALGLATRGARWKRPGHAALRGDVIDPPTFVGVVIVCAGAGLLASALPAMTAARVDPTAALKGD